VNKQAIFQRIEKLQQNVGKSITVFTLANGKKHSIKRNAMLTAYSNAIDGIWNDDSNALKNAVSTNNGSRLYELIQALNGPLIRAKDDEE